jgi:organic hydroperoxide reductase OsmC/OhrA
LATRILQYAATEGIELTALEVLATSRSDLRGMFGMADSMGVPVGAGPSEIQLQVRISAAGVLAERLRRLVEDSHQCAPISAAARTAVPVVLRIDVEAA